MIEKYYTAIEFIQCMIIDHTYGHAQFILFSARMG